MDDLDFLTFEPDFSSPSILTAYDELPLWSAMFGLPLLEEVPFIKLGFLDAWKNVVPDTMRETFTRLRDALDARGELRLTIPMAYVEATA